MGSSTAVLHLAHLLGLRNDILVGVLSEISIKSCIFVSDHSENTTKTI